MMAQYWAIKQANPDCLLFYRMGDFYEMFFEDAGVAAAALDITLTKRGQHQGEEVPMCGVPVHAAEAYLSRLIRQGFKVAICEQLEDPAEAKKRGSKSVVRRDVVRLVTPGTITEDELLDARRHNYLAALGEAAGSLGLAWVDISTGDFFAEETTAAGLPAALARLDPGELLLPDRLLQPGRLDQALAEWRERLSPLPGARFDSENARRRLESLFEVGALDAFGQFGRAELAAAGALVDYVELTQKGKLPRLAPPRRLARGETLEIDGATRRNLELTRSLSGERKGSLLATIDRTVTGAGARLLAQRLSAPLTDPAAIEGRLEAVGFLREEAALRGDLRDALRRCPDIERALSRLSLGRGGPRDLAAVRDGLAGAATLQRSLAALPSGAVPQRLAASAARLGGHDALVERLGRALAAELPLQARDGGFVARGFSAELDELKALRDESRRLIAGLQADYAADTGIQSLKIKHNNVLGYFIEVSAANAGRMPTGADSPYRQRQSLAGAVRFSTVELAELEQRIVSAGDKALALELRLFEELAAAVLERAAAVADTAAALAEIDVAAALAEIAAEQDWCRPAVEDSARFEVTGGRHPVVEAALKRGGDGPFVANDCRLLPDDRIWLLTGPNMAGKSTFLRQNALIALLAQAGSFVPAERAVIGTVDRLFSRVGAADDLARGRSTFMVEMVEAAAILNQAGPRSLVILDEIGRGTATFDGLSIAWACVEHLHEKNRCRALFATHYHELTSLAAKLPALSCHSMRVKEWQDQVIFLHEVAAGAADRSYGIHVAKLAGLPAAAVARAEEVLAVLEQGEQASALTRLADDLPLFAATAARAEKPGPKGPSTLDRRLAEINPDELTPRQALELLYELRRLAPDAG
ncbi:DNA mismatch repair protein MutS [Tistlia consotensis]|uniref:DNA mismatch repair protein MutS n=1 Tax=Tistlia consotensis USBA 355 TaxID=560819 RepID=A0A1Y6CLK8_9PROT|nr:DNA mismatch repair protein MutS [Tistlia consotensis]SMF74165.1 DNA mismatch repair protein MutS [Tistlia consotensis USBA 355]SNS10266.1 DNA mismatch repair protein MutS [Tistlia consotensis]